MTLNLFQGQRSHLPWDMHVCPMSQTLAYHLGGAWPISRTRFAVFSCDFPLKVIFLGLHQALVWTETRHHSSELTAGLRVSCPPSPGAPVVWLQAWLGSMCLWWDPKSLREEHGRVHGPFSITACFLLQAFCSKRKVAPVPTFGNYKFLLVGFAALHFLF